MEDTDIYKSREAMPIGSGRTPKRRHRRSRSEHTINEDQPRRRRSRNSGLRRVLHLARKPKYQRRILISIGVITVLFLLITAIWEFVIVEQQARKANRETEYVRKTSTASSAEESAAE